MKRAKRDGPALNALCALPTTLTPALLHLSPWNRALAVARERCVSLRTSRGRSFYDFSRWVLSQRWRSLETSQSHPRYEFRCLVTFVATDAWLRSDYFGKCGGLFSFGTLNFSQGMPSFANFTFFPDESKDLRLRKTLNTNLGAGGVKSQTSQYVWQHHVRSSWPLSRNFEKPTQSTSVRRLR